MNEETSTSTGSTGEETAPSSADGSVSDSSTQTTSMTETVNYDEQILQAVEFQNTLFVILIALTIIRFVRRGRA